MFVAKQQGDEIVLSGDEDGVSVRWIFSEIGRDSFQWRAEVYDEPDGGRRRVQEMSVRRAG